MWFRQELLKLQICLALASLIFFPKGRSLHRRTKKPPNQAALGIHKKHFSLRAKIEYFYSQTRLNCFFRKLSQATQLRLLKEQEGLGCILVTSLGQLQIQGIWKMLLSIKPLKMSSSVLSQSFEPQIQNETQDGIKASWTETYELHTGLHQTDPKNPSQGVKLYFCNADKTLLNE